MGGGAALSATSAAPPQPRDGGTAAEPRASSSSHGWPASSSAPPAARTGLKASLVCSERLEVLEQSMEKQAGSASIRVSNIEETLEAETRSREAEKDVLLVAIEARLAVAEDKENSMAISSNEEHEHPMSKQSRKNQSAVAGNWVHDSMVLWNRPLECNAEHSVMKAKTWATACAGAHLELGSPSRSSVSTRRVPCARTPSSRRCGAPRGDRHRRHSEEAGGCMLPRL